MEKSIDPDHSDQLQADLAKARKKRQKRSDSPRTPSGSPPPQPPPPPPPAGASGAPGSGALSSSKTANSTQQSMAWTTSDTRYESVGFTATQETSPIDYLMNDDSIPDEQWKPLPEEERPATPKPAWTISSSNVSDVENNWASALVSTYEPPAKKSLLAKTGDMMTFMNCSILRDMILCHIEEKSENTSGFSVSSESNPIQDMGHLDHLLGFDKRVLSTALNLTKPGWDAKGFEFKYDYTIIESLRAVVFPVNNNERKIMRFNEIYKFSDGTLIRILEALDYRVKEFKIKRLNLEHPSDTYVFTMKMEILLEPTSNKLMVQVKMEMEIPHSSGVYFITAFSYLTNISKELMKAQVTTNNQAFTLKKGMSMPVQMSQAQDGERPQVNDQRLDLADDLKEGWVIKPNVLWFHWISFDYRVPLGFGSIVGSLDPVNPVIRLPIEHGISRGTRVEYEDVGEIDIETLTLEQYLALNLNNTRRRISNPEDATFAIKGQFLRELRKTTTSGSPTENAIEHIGKVLEVASLFNANDFALLRVFSLTLVGVAKRWFNRTSTEHAKNWDELKQIFI
ncbi:hypothetical protein Tco_0667832 [Tanacetum coccineum]